MKKNYNAPVVNLYTLASEDIMALNASGEYDEKSNSISWDDLSKSIGLGV